jgi:hypothetical protein
MHKISKTKRRNGFKCRGRQKMKDGSKWKARAMNNDNDCMKQVFKSN